MTQPISWQLDSAHPNHRLLAAGWFSLGLFLYLMMLPACWLLRELNPPHDTLSILLNSALDLVIGVVFGWPGARCFIRARRLRAPSALEVLARYPQPPVLYLRPFAADQLTSAGVGWTSWITDEEHISKAFEDLGSFVGIGEPSETLPRVGAARLYADDSEWHKRALELIRNARLVVLRIGDGAGLLWELETTVRTKAPHELVLLIPQDQQLYESFASAARTFMPNLPEIHEWRRRRWFRANLKAVICGASIALRQSDAAPL